MKIEISREDALALDWAISRAAACEKSSKQAIEHGVLQSISQDNLKQINQLRELRAKFGL